MLKKRGQAALEFLTTYGWAFLVMLIVIAALAYFGFLDPSSLTGGRCQLGPEMACKDYIIEDGAGALDLQFRLVLTNNVGSAINVYGIGVDDSSTQVSSYSCASVSNPIGAGQDFIVSCDVAGSFPPVGDKQKFALDINYTKIGGAFNHTVGGEVYSAIQ